MSQYTPSYGQPVGGPTWMGSPPRPKPLDLFTAKEQMMRAGDPQARRAEGMKLGLIPMDAPPQSQGRGGGGGRAGRGGGGGPTFGFAPTNFSDGSRYNAEGYRADGRKKIQGFSADAAGLPDFGGLNEFYANQEGTQGNRTNPAFYAGSENNNQPFSSPEIAGALDKNGMELVPFAGDVIPVPKRDQGSPDVDPAGMPFAVRRDGEIRVNQDGSVVPLKQGLYLPPQAGVVLTPEQQVTIPQLPNEVVPTEALTMLTDEWARGKQAANDARLAQSGITDYGGGFKALSNPYGTGSAVPAGVPQARYFADERGQMQPMADGKLIPMPDPLATEPGAQAWAALNGIMPADPRIPREQIQLNAQDMQTGAMDRRANDLFGLQQAEAVGLAAQIQQNLKDRRAAGLPMMAPQAMVTPNPGAGAMASATPADRNVRAPLAQIAGLPMIPGLPMSAVRGGQTAMNRYLDSPAGRQAVGQQMLQRAMTPPVDNTPSFVPLPGTGYGMAYAGNRPFSTVPMLQQQQQTQDPNANLLADVERAQSPLTLQTIMQRSNDPAVIKAARSRLDKMQSAAPVEDYVFRTDPVTGKLDQQKWVKGKKPPPGYQRMQDENNDGVPDAMQPQQPMGSNVAPTADVKNMIKGLFARPAGR